MNALEEQEILTDRVQMYERLTEAGIPCPPHTVIDHGSVTPGELVQDVDSITWRGQVLPKPFVEKPQDADDHAVWIYHVSSEGGGATKLHRKKGNQSSIRDLTQSHIRENGMYVYEPFMETGGLDIKVYAVGETYAHAEVRKAPAVDGRVELSALSLSLSLVGSGREESHKAKQTTCTQILWAINFLIPTRALLEYGFYIYLYICIYTYIYIYIYHHYGII